MIFDIDVPKDQEEHFRKSMANCDEKYRCNKLIALVKTLPFGTDCRIIESEVLAQQAPIAPQAVESASDTEAIARVRDNLSKGGYAFLHSDIATLMRCYDAPTANTPAPIPIDPPVYEKHFRKDSAMSERLAHVANEWADVATNGYQWLKNVREGISTFDEALEDMKRGFEYCRAVGSLARSRPANTPAVPDELLSNIHKAQARLIYSNSQKDREQLGVQIGTMINNLALATPSPVQERVEPVVGFAARYKGQIEIAYLLTDVEREREELAKCDYLEVVELRATPPSTVGDK